MRKFLRILQIFSFLNFIRNFEWLKIITANLKNNNGKVKEVKKILQKYYSNKFRKKVEI